MKIEMENRWNVVARKASAIALAGVLAMGMYGCAGGAASSQSESASQGATSQANAASQIDESRYDLDYSDRDSDPSYDEASAEKIDLSAAGGDVAISAAGVYVLSGTLTDGQVVVNAPEDAKVQLVLDGASITNADGPAINVQQADKCFVTLAEGSENKLSDGATYADADADANATLYAACDLTLQGTGKLSVSGNFNDAIKTADDLVITGGSYAVKATSDALAGHDSVKVSGGTFAIDAGNDAIKSSKDDDESKGFVSIDGGTFKVNATDKGVTAVTYARVADGANLDITAGDDAIHSDNSARIAGGEISISSGDDAVHAEYTLVIDGGNVDVSKCVEGYEAQVITVNGSTTNIVASDDGINAATAGTSSSAGEGNGNGGQMPEGEPPSGERPEMPNGERPEMPNGERPELPEVFNPGQGAPPSGAPSGSQPQDGSSSDSSGERPALPEGFDPQNGGFGGMMGSDESCILTINGGTITVEAGGDGVDSNGYFYMNGGDVRVSGPTNAGNGSVDYGISGEVTGGTFIAAGSTGMAESFTGGTQGFALVNASGSAGDTISVKDSSGKVLAEFTPTKAFQCVVVSAPGMANGSEYTLSVNGSDTTFTATTEGSSTGGFGSMSNGGQRSDAANGATGGQPSSSAASTTV